LPPAIDICAVAFVDICGALPLAFAFFPFAFLPTAFPVGAGALTAAVGAGALTAAVGAGALAVGAFAIVAIEGAAFAIEGAFIAAEGAAAEGAIAITGGTHVKTVGGDATALMLPHVPLAALEITPIMLAKLAMVVPSVGLVESSMALQLPPVAVANSISLRSAP